MGDQARIAQPMSGKARLLIYEGDKKFEMLVRASNAWSKNKLKGAAVVHILRRFWVVTEAEQWRQATGPSIHNSSLEEEEEKKKKKTDQTSLASLNCNYRRRVFWRCQPGLCYFCISAPFEHCTRMAKQMGCKATALTVGVTHQSIYSRQYGNI